MKETPGLSVNAPRECSRPLGHTLSLSPLFVWGWGGMFPQCWKIIHSFRFHFVHFSFNVTQALRSVIPTVREAEGFYDVGPLLVAGTGGKTAGDMGLGAGKRGHWFKGLK